MTGGVGMSWGVGPVRGSLGAGRGVGVLRVYWGLARSVGTRGPEGYRWH